MKIPKRFKLYGYTFDVEYKDDLMDEENFEGMAKLRGNKIYIQSVNSSFSRPKEHLERTFLHELVHVILFQMYENDMGRDEKFVETFASLLHQAIITMEYK